MSNQIYGYIRVSTREQNEARQKIAMKKFNIPNNQIYMDKQSGKDFERQEYKKMLKRIHEGDTLVIKSIDRLGRNYSEIIEQWQFITKKKKAYIVVIDIPLLDTRVEKDLTRSLISDLVLQLLSYVAETERMFIRQRQQEGIDAALERGVKFGREAIEKPANCQEVVNQWKSREISLSEGALQLGVSKSTFFRWAHSD